MEIVMGIEMKREKRLRLWSGRKGGEADGLDIRYGDENFVDGCVGGDVSNGDVGDDYVGA